MLPIGRMSVLVDECALIAALATWSVEWFAELLFLLLLLLVSDSLALFDADVDRCSNTVAVIHDVKQRCKRRGLVIDVGIVNMWVSSGVEDKVSSRGSVTGSDLNISASSLTALLSSSADGKCSGCRCTLSVIVD